MSREVAINTVKGFIAISEKTLEQMKENRELLDKSIKSVKDTLERDYAKLKELEKEDEPEDKG